MKPKPSNKWSVWYDGCSYPGVDKWYWQGDFPQKWLAEEYARFLVLTHFKGCRCDFVVIPCGREPKENVLKKKYQSYKNCNCSEKEILWANDIIDSLKK